MISKVVMPLGELAGKERELPNALFNLANDMLRQRDVHQSNIHWWARDTDENRERANELERYALALFFIWYQAEEPAQREQQISGPLAGYLELAGKHNLTLPPELEARAHKERAPRKPRSIFA